MGCIQSINRDGIQFTMVGAGSSKVHGNKHMVKPAKDFWRATSWGIKMKIAMKDTIAINRATEKRGMRGKKNKIRLQPGWKERRDDNDKIIYRYSATNSKGKPTNNKGYETAEQQAARAQGWTRVRPQATDSKYVILKKSESITTLYNQGQIVPGSEVISARKEIDAQKAIIRESGEVGTVTYQPPSKDRTGKKQGRLTVCVEWSGKDRNGKKFEDGHDGSRGFTQCLVIAYSRPKRRRMSQREFSNRRDSPVMVRLLEQIIDAQDD